MDEMVKNNKEETEAVDLFSNHMTNQLDLQVEANNLKRFRYNFGLLDGGSDDNDVHLFNNRRKNVHFQNRFIV